MEVRLQKYLADVGVASRRAAEKLIEEGKIKINGHVVSSQGIKVNPEQDIIEYEGKKLKLDIHHHYYMLHKPTRYVTTASDEKGRATVLDLVNVKERIFPIGRLDYMSSGLILLTNDGDLTYKLTHPKHDIDKQYIVKIEPKVSRTQIEVLKRGVDLEIYKTSPCQIHLLKEDDTSQTYQMSIHEGKNRQIRRMFEFVGSQVVRLKRIAVGELNLGDLELGAYRELTKKEIEYLKNL